MVLKGIVSMEVFTAFSMGVIFRVVSMEVFILVFSMEVLMVLKGI